MTTFEDLENEYNEISEELDIARERLDKYILDAEIELEHEMREEIEKKYGLKWWQVIQGEDEDKDYEITIKSD